MKSTPLVSVIMTLYNRERYVAAAIESVRAQTFQDWELIIVDDGSTDRSPEIARERASQDPRIRFVQNENNLGDYPNRNHAATFATGTYTKYCDSDDLMYPHCLEVMVRFLESAPRAEFATSGGWLFPGGPCPMLLTPRMCYQREFLGSGLFNLGPSSFLFRTEFFHQNKMFPLAGPHSDYVFWLSAAKRCHVLLLPADLFWYRIHPGQHLQTPGAEKDLFEVIQLTWEALHADDCPLEPSEREIAKRNWSYLIAKKSLHNLRSFRWGTAYQRLRRSGLSLFDWLRYLRRPSRNQMAGSPMDENGEFLDPSWIQDASSPELLLQQSA